MLPHLRLAGIVFCVAVFLSASLRAEPVNNGPTSQSGASTEETFWNRDFATGDWGGLRGRLEDKGVSIGITWLLDGFYNFRGGIRTGATAASTFDASITLDMHKMLDLHGGTFYADIEDHAGANPSRSLVGDVQTFDKHNFPPYFEVFELWYQQKLFSNTLRVKAGKVDANTEFSVISNGLEFLNSSAQVPPTMFVLPTTPAPMPGINVFYTPKGPLYAGFGLYDSNRTVDFLDFYGNPESGQPTPNGKFLIGETGLTWERIPALNTDGNFRLGFWGHTGTFERFGGGTQAGVRGFYAILDQTLWTPETPSSDARQQGTRGIRAFLDYGQTDRAVSRVYRNFGTGITWTGPLKTRPKDVAGLGAQYARLSPGADLPHNFELALEAFYQLRITGWADLQPDLQYVVHPGGRYPSALVGTLRCKIVF